MSFYTAPHFDLPFRFDATAAATVEQDTVDDVANCMKASLLTDEGQRPQVPTFGTGDLTFNQQPLDPAAIAAKISADEPRAILLITQQPSRLDELVAEVTALVSTQGTQ